MKQTQALSSEATGGLDRDGRIELTAHIFNSRDESFPVSLMVRIIGLPETELRKEVATLYGPVPGVFAERDLEWRKAYSILYDYLPITLLDEVFAYVNEGSRLHPSRHTQEVTIYLPGYVLQAIEESGIDLNQAIYDSLARGGASGGTERAMELHIETDPTRGAQIPEGGAS